MRATLISTCNMVKARANATGDEMLHGLAATLVIIVAASYAELDGNVWDYDDYVLAVRGQ